MTTSVAEVPQGPREAVCVWWPFVFNEKKSLLTSKKKPFNYVTCKDNNYERIKLIN